MTRSRSIFSKDALPVFSALIPLFALCLLFPYSSDDWAMRAAPFNFGIDSFNGRYLGSILIRIFTHFYILRSLIMALTIFGVCFIIQRTINPQKPQLFFLSLFLLLTIPKKVFAQTIVWSSGFCNYTIPILLTLYWFYIAGNRVWKNSAIERANKTGVCAIAGAFLLSFASAFFMEHIAIYNVFSGLFFTLISIKRKRKDWGFFAAYLCGAIAGAVLMFINPANQTVVAEAGGYRSLPINGIISFFERFFDSIFGLTTQELFLNNFILSLAIVIMIVRIWLRSEQRCGGPEKWRLSLSFAGIILCFSLNLYRLLFLKWQPLGEKWTPYLFGLAMLCFFLCVLIFLFDAVEEHERRERLIFELISASVLIAPVQIVTPFTSRCLAPAFPFLILLVADLADYRDEAVSPCRATENQREKKSVQLNLILFLSAWLFLMSVYIPNCHYNNQRIKFAQNKNARGNKIINIARLPYEEYVNDSNPENKFFSDGFKASYGIAPDVFLKVIPFEDWLANLNQP